MAQWKRVYVPGKGYRWTDGKGNYKTSNPSFRNPANSAVNAGASAVKGAAKSAANAASKSVSATANATSRTAENERNASSNAIGYRARKQAEKEAAKPKTASNLEGVSSTNDIARLRREQEAARQAQLGKANRKPPAGTPKPSNTAPTPQASRPAGTQPSRPAAASKPSPKPIPKASSKAAPASETYRDGGKGLYQGTQAYRDKVGGSGNPLLNRFRQDMGRDTATGQKGNGNYSKPEDKSQYVASNGQPYKGPAFGNNKNGSEKLRQAMDDQKKKREEERKRLMASRKGTSWGGVS